MPPRALERSSTLPDADPVDLPTFRDTGSRGLRPGVTQRGPAWTPTPHGVPRVTSPGDWKGTSRQSGEAGAQDRSQSLVD